MHYTKEIADEYAKNRDKYTSTDSEVFSRIDPEDIEGKDVLDLGRGDGSYSIKLKGLGARSVLGVDVSSAMIELAQKRSEPGIAFTVGSAEHIPATAEEFDLIFSNFVLHYCPDTSLVFKEMSRVLRPGGKAVFIFNISETEKKELLNTWIPISIGGHITVLNLIKSHDEMRAGAEASGLHILEYTEVDSSYLSIGADYAHRDDIWKIRNIVCVLQKPL